MQAKRVAAEAAAGSSSSSSSGSSDKGRSRKRTVNLASGSDSEGTWVVCWELGVWCNANLRCFLESSPRSSPSLSSKPWWRAVVEFESRAAAVAKASKGGKGANNPLAAVLRGLADKREAVEAKRAAKREAKKARKQRKKAAAAAAAAAAGGEDGGGDGEEEDIGLKLSAFAVDKDPVTVVGSAKGYDARVVGCFLIAGNWFKTMPAGVADATHQQSPPRIPPILQPEAKTRRWRRGRTGAIR